MTNKVTKSLSTVAVISCAFLAPGKLGAQINYGPSSVIGSGPYSSIAGGDSSENDAAQSTIAGGYQNFIDVGADYSFIGAGALNYSGAYGGTIGGGQGNQLGPVARLSVISGGVVNQILGTNGVIGGGYGNKIPGTTSYSTIGGGLLNTNQGHYATIGGGWDNTVSATNAAIPGGNGAVASHFGELAHASGFFAHEGDAQAMEFVVRGTSTGTNLSELFLDGVGQRMTIPLNATWICHILIAGRTSTGLSKTEKATCTVKNVNGTVSLLGTDVSVAQGDQGWPGWLPPTFLAENGAFVIKADTAAGSSARWMATVRVAQLQW